MTPLTPVRACSYAAGDASEALTMFEDAGLPCPMLRSPTE